MRKEGVGCKWYRRKLAEYEKRKVLFSTEKPFGNSAVTVSADEFWSRALPIAEMRKLLEKHRISCHECQRMEDKR